jgi:hypothetical protein
MEGYTMNTTYERLERAKQNIELAKGILARTETAMYINGQVADLEAIARTHTNKTEQEHMFHQIRQYRALTTEVGCEEAYKLVFEGGYQIKWGLRRNTKAVLGRYASMLRWNDET